MLQKLEMSQRPSAIPRLKRRNRLMHGTWPSRSKLRDPISHVGVSAITFLGFVGEPYCHTLREAGHGRQAGTFPLEHRLKFSGRSSEVLFLLLALVHLMLPAPFSSNPSSENQ